MTDEETVREIAREVGFDLVGIAPLAPPRAAARFESWLAQGYQAGMGWLGRQRERILDPGRILPGGKSLLALGFSHRRAPVELEGGGRVARYAAGRDYHNVLGKLLRKLASRLARENLIDRNRRIVDAGPLLERSHAAEAGIGFESKAANLLARDFGPWFFLAELLVDAEFEPGSGSPPGVPLGSCGTCTACIDACPTSAIRSPGVVDANLCISYHTIENRGAIPRELRAALGGWAFGCDVCSEVCPWGKPGSEGDERLGTHREVGERRLTDWLRTKEESFSEVFRGSPLQRPKRAGLARNAALALGHSPSEEGRTALLDALENDPSDVVREAAGWSLARAHGEEQSVRATLERAAQRALHPEEVRGLRLSLEDAKARRDF